MDASIHPLKLARHQQNLTQKRLAQEAGVGSQTILRAEHYKPINAESRRAICDYFGKTPEELGLVQIQQVPDDKALTFPPTLTVPAPLPYSPPPVPQSALVIREPDPMGRHADMPYRDLMRALTITGAALTIPVPELLHLPLWERLTRAIAPSPDELLLLHLEQAVYYCTQLLPKVQGVASRELLNYIVDRLLIVSELLEYSSSRPILIRLANIASEFAQLAGEIYFDAKDGYSAQRYYTCAIAAAKIAENPLLQATALGRKSFVPVYEHKAQNALPLLAEARSLSSQQAPALTKAWLWAIEAEAQANLQDENSCLKALDYCEAALERVQPDEPSPVRFGRTAMLGYRGLCALRLHRSDKAETILQQALDSMEPGRLRHKAIVLIDLATTYVQQIEIEEACRFASHALLIIAQIQSFRVLQRLLTFRKRLAPWHDTPSVGYLDEQIKILKPYISTLSGQ